MFDFSKAIFVTVLGMAILPKVYASMYGAEFPWMRNKDVISNVCLDPKNPLIFEIKGVRK